MKKNPSSSVEKSEYIGIQKDLLKEAGQATKEIGKPIQWLQYAVKTRYSYRLLKNKNKQLEVLERILTSVSAKYPKYTRGQIADILSELVNSNHRYIND